MINIYNIFENIEKRPGAFLFERSITHLRTLMAGYSLAKMELNVEPTEQDLEFAQFQDWIQNKYRVTASKSWSTIILEHSDSENEAFNRFFELLKEFREKVSEETEKIYPLRGLPITISDDFDEPMPELWEVLAE